MDFGITGKKIKGTAPLQGQAITPKPAPKKPVQAKPTQPIKPKSSLNQPKAPQTKQTKPQHQK